MPASRSKVLINEDGNAWFSAPPDPATFQEFNVQRVFVFDGTVWTEAIGVNVFDGTVWKGPGVTGVCTTVATTDATTCVGSPTLPHYQVNGSFITPLDAYTAEITVTKDGVAQTAYTVSIATPGATYSFAVATWTMAQGDDGTRSASFSVRVKQAFGGYGGAVASNSTAVPRWPCSRPS